MKRIFLVMLLFSSLPGCDTLFPELANDTSTDLAGTDAATDLSTNVLSGRVCVLSNLSNPTICGLGANRRITIEETRAFADVASDGTFSISLAGVLDTATMAVEDSATSAGISTPTITVLSGALLTLARAQGASLPSVTAQSMNLLNLEMGVGTDASRGAVLAWLVNAAGTPIAGAQVAPIAGGSGPLYDSGGSLEQGVVTGSYGTVAYLGLPAGTAQLVVTTNAMSAVAGSTFIVPVRSSAITTSALVLPQR